MKKKIWILSMIFISCMFLITSTQETYANTLTPTYEFKDNLVKNHRLLYTSTSTTIDDWIIDATYHLNTEATRTLKFGTTVENGFRNVVRNDNLKPTDYDNWTLGAENTTGVFRSISKLSTRYDNSQPYLQNIRQVIDVKPNTAYTYYIVARAISEDGGALPEGNNIGLRIMPGDRSAVPGASYMSDPDLRLTENITRKQWDFNSGSNTTISLSLRFLKRNNVIIEIEAVGLVEQVKYLPQRNAFNLFEDRFDSGLYFMSKEDFDSQVATARTQLNASAVTDEIRNDVNARLDRAIALRAIIDQAYASIDDLYTDSSKTAIKDSVTNEMISNLRTQINNDVSPAYLSDMMSKLDNAQLIKDIQDEKITQADYLRQVAANFKDMVDSLSDLTESEKATYKSQIDTTLNQQLLIIPQGTSVVDVQEKSATANQKILDVFLLAAQVNAKNKVDNEAEKLISELDSLTSLTEAEKQAYIDEINSKANVAKDAISLADSKEAADQLRDQFLSELNLLDTTIYQTNAKQAIDNKVEELTQGQISPQMQAIIDAQKALIDLETNPAIIKDLEEKALEMIELQHEKEQAILALTNKTETLKNEIDALANLTEVEKETFKDNLDAILLDKVTNINNKETKEDVSTSLNNGNTLLNAEKLEATKKDAMNLVDREVDRLIEMVQDSTKLTSDQKQSFIDALEEKRTEINTNIDESTNQQAVNNAKNNGLSDLEDMDLAIYKQEAKNEIQNKFDDAVAEINDLANLTQDQKDALIDKLTDLKEVGEKAIDDAETKAVIDRIVSSVVNDFDQQIDVATAKAESNLETALTIYKDLFEREYQNKLSDVNSLNSLTTDQKNQVIDLLTSIKVDAFDAMDNATSVSELQAIYRQNEQLLINARDEAFLQNNKNIAANDVVALYDQLVIFVDELTYLTEAEKDLFKSELLTIKDQGLTNINNATTTSQVTTARNQAISSLNNKRIEIYRKDSDNLIEVEHQNLIDLIRAITDLSETKQDQFIEDALEIYEKAKTDLLATTTINQMDRLRDQVIASLTNVYLEARVEEIVDKGLAKAQLKTDLETKYLDAVAKINGLTHLTETEKQSYLEQLLTERNTGINLIDTAKTVDLAEIKYLDAVSNIDAIILDAVKVDTLAYIFKHVQDLTEGGTLNQDLAEKIIELNTNINNATSEGDIETILTEGLADFDVLFEDLLVDKKKEVKDALEAYAKDNEDLEEKAIIETYVNQVTTTNFGDDILINEIIQNGKAALDQLYQDRLDSKKGEVKTLLETYAGSPRSQEVNQIIQDAVDLVIITNYDDETRVNQIVDDAKTLILERLKTEAKADIDLLKQEEMTPEIEQMITDAKAAIDAATTPEEVKSLLEQKQREIQNQYIIEEVENAKNELDDYMGEDASDYIKDLVEKAKDALDDATSTEEVNSIVAETKILIDERRALEVEIEAAKEELDNSLPLDASDVLRAIVSEGKDSLVDATTKEELDQMVADIIDSINNQILAEAKMDAKDRLNIFAGTNPNQSLTAILNAEKAMIDTATTTDQIDTLVVSGLRALTNEMLEQIFIRPRSTEMTSILNSYLNEVTMKSTEAELNDILERAQTAFNNQVLLEAKQAAKQELDDALGDNPTDEMIKAVEDAKDRIDNATSKEEIETIKNDTKDALKDMDKEVEPAQEVNVLEIVVFVESAVIVFLLLFIGIVLFKKRNI